MEVQITTSAYLAGCLEGFFFGEISVLLSTTVTLLSKEVQNYPILGIYSGMFAIYLQYHIFKKESDDAKRNTVSYALCVLYVLSAASIALQIAFFRADGFVSNNDHHF